MPINVFAFSYAFPPIAVPQSIQVIRFLKNLNANVAVICCDDPYRQQDMTIAPDYREVVDQIIRLPLTKQTAVIRNVGRVANKLYLSWENIPDRWRPWVLQTSQKFWSGQIKLNFEPDLLITFGQPMSDHLFGLTYKQKTGKPWIAHFSDPWVDNPFRRDNPLTKWLNRRMERQVFAAADALIFTSPETIDLVMSQYPDSWQQKTFYVPHCYDLALYDDALKPPSDKYVLRSVGSFYGPRSPRPLFAAVERIGRETPQLLQDVSIELVGDLGKFRSQSYPIAQKFIKCIDTVPYGDAIRLMQSAHCLLVIDAPLEQSVFFPSKLVEYIGANRFILAITPPGTSSRIVRELGGIVASPTDINAVVQTIKQVLEEKLDSLPQPTEIYSGSVVSKQMQQIIETVLSSNIEKTTQR